MKRKVVPVIALFVGLMLLVFLLQRHMSWDELIAHESTLREQIAHPFRAALIGFSVYVLVSLVPGAAGKSVVFGWLFGIWVGLLIVSFGLTIAAVLSFLASRYLFRDAVQSRFGYHIQRIDDAVSRDGASYLFMLRVLHCPYTVTNYAFGATSLRTSSFWWATQLGMLPGNVIFVYAGSQVPSLRQLADEGAKSVFSWQIVGALVILSVMTILIRYAVGRRLSRVSRQA